ETDEPAARRSPGRPVSPASRGDRQPSPSAGAAGGGDRLGLSGATLQRGVSGGTPAAAGADAAGGPAGHSLVGDPYFPYFWGEVVFRHELPFDRSSLTRWRQRLGEEQIVALLQESLSVAHRTGAIDTKDLERVAIDTTVQEKAIAHPTDARLTHRAIEKLVELAKREGVELRQSYLRLAKRAAIMVGHACPPVQTRAAGREVSAHAAWPHHP